MQRAILSTVLIGLLFFAFNVSAEEPAPTALSEVQDGDSVIVQLRNKDIIQGKLLRRELGKYVIDSFALGTLEIPIDQVEKIERSMGELEVHTEIKKKEKKKIWESKVSAGVNGSSGNSNNFSMRAAAGTKRTTERNRLSLDGTYILDFDEDSTTKSQKKTGHKATADVRSEWPFPSIPRLNYFIAGSYVFDEFRDCEQRAAGNTGLGYDVVKTDTLLVGVHGGAGVSQEFGCTPNPLTPEAVIGGNLDWSVTKLQKVTASADIFPDLRDLGEFRSVEKAAWVFFTSEDKALNFSLGAEHRYDSTPGTSKANDFVYYASIGWLF